VTSCVVSQPGSVSRALIPPHHYTQALYTATLWLSCTDEITSFEYTTWDQSTNKQLSFVFESVDEFRSKIQLAYTNGFKTARLSVVAFQGSQQIPVTAMHMGVVDYAPNSDIIVVACNVRAGGATGCGEAANYLNAELTSTSTLTASWTARPYALSAW